MRVFWDAHESGVTLAPIPTALTTELRWPGRRMGQEDICRVVGSCPHGRAAGAA